ncbi:MAG: hypothetical protein U9R50_07330 [Campylobacterota bacterium]|nr:hypothetical protein [Campylobacterota bacterium]
MNNAEKYFEQQKQNSMFTQGYNEITEQVDIEWELERVKQHIEADYAKKTILQEIEKLQNFIHQATFIPQVKVIV